MASTSSHSTPMSIHVTFRGTTHTLADLLPSTALAQLHQQLADLTGVSPSVQKLLYKGKKATWKSKDLDEGAVERDEVTLVQAGLKDGTKVQLLGSTSQELEGLKKEENEHQRRERIMRERALKAPVKVRNTTSPFDPSSLTYRFHNLLALQHLPNPASAHALLTRLSNDAAIQHIMRTHRFSVGLLTELAPHEHPELLGLNVNAGEAIKLRLRTNAYDGFRTYKEVRKVLCHELSHNVWGDHDNDFKELNSKLNREVAEYERSVAAGTHHLSGGPAYDTYQPSSELEAEARAYTLGGTPGGGSRDWDNETREERRRRVLDATMNRLRKEEEDIEHSCGTGKPAATGA